MVGCDGLLWHQYIADYRLHADKELVAKISQDAKERQSNAGGDRKSEEYKKSVPVQGREAKIETGETTETLAEIAGTGPASPHGGSWGSLHRFLSRSQKASMNLKSKQKRLQSK